MLVRWLPWEGDAFARAAREHKPVLLSITTPWCRACADMDATTYASAEVATAIDAHLVPVRVDAGRRPDINERYNLGGCPTTAFLTADGAVITGGTVVTVERMVPVIVRVAAEFARIAASVGENVGDDALLDATPGDAADALSEEGLIDAIFASLDEQPGGSCVPAAFPYTAPLHLAMALFRDTGDEHWRSIAERGLDAVADRPRSEPALLEPNAALLRACAEAAIVFERQVDRDRCAALARFITATFARPGGGLRASEAEDVAFVDGNATAAGALLGAATVLGDEALARETLASFERVLLACYRPGGGLAHFAEAGSVRGLLSDQVAAIAALLDAHDVSDGEPYRMMAEELGLFMANELWDSGAGGFYDRIVASGDIGLLRRRRKPFVGNAEAALALARVARLEPRKGFPDPAEFTLYAEGALRTAAAQLDRQGPLAAHYALASRQLIK